ncbi:sugar phosphate nucleotidyltransferase [Staphylothermus hellenicus]|uniref:Nucleotidyl transferase n=1 Tax=Staphylothermus hellenicus (strain DSM 12710 / JCM 10830 / BK20S6-10-b1 / P8) TaxID=591019 RepID=D7DAG9_STAHD|nr:NDP-sugar synthase [Staphylothermus hellenicus]ADI31166.1 Nucleotidyl transferase [Staphylothermus hellenicus DSM 12710]
MTLKNLVLAAGKAKPELSVLIPPGKNKVLLRILGKPVLYYPLTSVQRVNREETILVYREGEEEVVETSNSISLGTLTPVKQVEGTSVREAILVAENKLRDTDYFFLVYGDIIVDPEAFNLLLSTHYTEEPDATILIVPYDPEYAETYGLAIINEEGYVEKIISGEQARQANQTYIVGGIYILPTTILDYLEENNSLPEAINKLAVNGRVKTVLWNKHWIDIGYPTDILEATYQLLSELKYSKISGKAEIESTAIIKGPVIIEDNTYIDHYTVIKGPAYIGEKVFIGAHSFIREYNNIEYKVRIGSYNEIKKTNIQPYTLLDSKVTIVDSVIGENCTIETNTTILNVLPEKEKPPRLRTHIVYPPTKIIRKMGAVIGYNTRIGASTTISPGKIIKQESIIKPKSTI